MWIQERAARTQWSLRRPTPPLTPSSPPSLSSSLNSAWPVPTELRYQSTSNTSNTNRQSDYMLMLSCRCLPLMIISALSRVWLCMLMSMEDSSQWPEARMLASTRYGSGFTFMCTVRGISSHCEMQDNGHEDGLSIEPQWVEYWVLSNCKSQLVTFTHI